MGDAAQNKIIEGVVKTADAIKVTIGPAGKGVAMDGGFGHVEITRDGASVAKAIQFKDQEMNIGAQLVRKASELTETQAGDGTSSTAVLIKELCVRGKKAVGNGANVNEIQSGMLKTMKWLKMLIEKNSIPVDSDMKKIHMVATISANNDSQVGDLVVQAMEKVGIDGLITAELSSGLETIIDVTDGMKLEKGWASPQYITNQDDGTCVLENPLILVAGETLSTIPQVMNFFEDYQKNGEGRPLLIVCDDIDESVNMMLILNTLRGALKCCVVKGVDFGDGRKNVMGDLAVSTGANYLCQEFGTLVNQAKCDDLGRARKVVVSKDTCIIYEGGGDPEEVKVRAEIIRKRIEDKTTTDYDRTRFRKRLANLVGGIAIIKAGGATEVEKTNRKATIEDSILASKSAIAEGCVPGGGYVYFKAAKEIREDSKFWDSLVGDEKEGAEIVVKSLPVIMKTIIDNCGESSAVIMDRLRDAADGIGFNAKTKQIEDLFKAGVLDSAKVVRVSLENSISTASMILLTDCTIIEDNEECKCDSCSAEA